VIAEKMLMIRPKNIPMRDYYALMADIVEFGHDTDDRTGVGTRALFGRQIKFDLRKGFPLLTGKFVPFKLVAAELLWFLSGSTNNNDLKRLNGSDADTIWEEWAKENGDLGPIYGEQWRMWGAGGIDQIRNLIYRLERLPNDRRHVVVAWNPSCLPIDGLSPQGNVNFGLQALAPCHALFQMDVRKLTLGERWACLPESKESKLIDGHYNCTSEEWNRVFDRYDIPRFGISCHMYQRSADIFLGVPFNIASYALLTHIIGHLTGYLPLELTISFGNVHLYKNHFSQAAELLSRIHDLPQLPEVSIVGNKKSIDDFTSVKDFKLIGYKSHPAIAAPVAV